MTLSRIVTGLKSTSARFARSNRGNVAMIFALLLPVMVTSIGAAIDYSRAVNARSAMQAAADATALMISKEASGLTSAQITSKATAYFNALYNHPEMGSVSFSAAYSANSGNGASVTVNASGSMATDFMKLAGLATLPVSVSSQTKWGNVRYRVALALDNTGSMDDADKMNQLKIATKQMISDFYAIATTNEDVYMSIVPFAKDVNIGSSFKNANWLKWAGAGNNSDDSYTNTAGSCSSDNWWTTYKKSNCPGTWTALNKNSWNGCVMDRDQDKDTTNDIPDSGTASTMVWPQQYDACPTQMIGMTSVKSSKQTLIDKVDDMTPNGGTNQGIGVFWAWMTHSTAGPFPTPAKNANYTYMDVIVLLTDGMNTQNRFNGNGSSHSDEVDARQATLCANARAQGVKIFAVQVATNGDEISDVTKNCTTEPDNANYFSYITSATQMTVKFQNIFKELSKLRVSA